MAVYCKAEQDPFVDATGRASLVLLARLRSTRKTSTTLRMTHRAEIMMKYFVYILVNRDNSVMYVGITGDLNRRIKEHKNEQIDGFTKKYHVHKLVYYEEYSEVNQAIAREKQIKGWKREKKNQLVQTKNPNFDAWSYSTV